MRSQKTTYSKTRQRSVKVALVWCQVRLHKIRSDNMVFSFDVATGTV